jgi:hypothetical protein
MGKTGMTGLIPVQCIDGIINPVPKGDANRIRYMNINLNISDLWDLFFGFGHIAY